MLVVCGNESRDVRPQLPCVGKALPTQGFPAQDAKSYLDSIQPKFLS
jgi:hypothetical protein